MGTHTLHISSDDAIILKPKPATWIVVHFLCLIKGVSTLELLSFKSYLP